MVNIQRLLDEGLFTASYKFALLLALAVLSIERGDDSGEPLELTTDAIAEKFVQYYWRQVVPYATPGEATILQQDTDSAGGHREFGTRSPCAVWRLAHSRYTGSSGIAPAGSAARDNGEPDGTEEKFSPGSFDIRFLRKSVQAGHLYCEGAPESSRLLADLRHLGQYGVGEI
jgi:hypothetical protein